MARNTVPPPLVTHSRELNKKALPTGHHRPALADAWTIVDFDHFFGRSYPRKTLEKEAAALASDVQTRCLGHDRTQPSFRLFQGSVYFAAVVDQSNRGISDPADLHMHFFYSPYVYGHWTDTLLQNDNFDVAQQTAVFLGEMEIGPWGF